MLRKSKKLQTIVLVALLLLTTSVSCAATQTQQIQTMPQMERSQNGFYTDIRNNWAYEAISYVLDRKLLTGTSETTFSPSQPITRTAFASALARMSGEDTDSAQTSANSAQVSAEATSAQASETASLPREGMAVLLYEYAESIGLTEAAPSGNKTAGTFSDSAKISSSALPAINWVTSFGLMSGKSDNSFAPSGTASRAEAATVIYRLCKLIDETNTSDAFLSELSEKMETVKQYSDYKEDEYQTISLKGSEISFSGTGAETDGSTVKITKAGTYVISGSLGDGRIIVDSEDDENIRLVLNNAKISSSDGPPLLIKNAKNTILSLPAGTENALTDGTKNTYDENASGALFSADDLWINGSGSLKVTANYKDGISGNDDVRITQAKITIDAVDDGISANDSVILAGATVTVNAKGDGVKATTEDKIQKGYVAVTGGSLNVTSGADGLQSATLLYMKSGSVDVDTTGGDSGGSESSAKGLKSGGGIVIEGGNLNIDSIDDAIHSNGMIRIEGGTIAIPRCYEGIESSFIEISGGTISLTASDDGINAAGGVGNELVISGGNITVNASGDGIDVNGSASMTGGTVLINGPANDGNSALDYDGVFEISGGTLLAAGSSGMAMAPSSDSTQYTIANTAGSQTAGTKVRLADSTGKTVAEFTPSKAYSHVVVSSPEIKKGGTYTLYAGDTEVKTFTISVIVSGDTSSGFGMPGGGPGGGMPGGGNGGGERMPDGVKPPEGRTGGPGAGAPPNGGSFPGGTTNGAIKEQP